MGRAVPPIACPFCDSADVELVSPWGGQIITSQMRCRTCNTYFEAIRDEFGARAGELGAGAGEFGRGPGEPERTSSWTSSSADDQ